MARRAAQRPIEPEPEELEPDQEEGQLAQVTERNYTTTTYLKEIPAPAEAPQSDPLDTFLKSVAPDRQLKMHVSRLPNFERDGNAYPGASGRAYLTQFDFTPEMREGAYQSTIQHAFAAGAAAGMHAAGGWVAIELREKGIVRHRWHECISPGPPATGPIAGNPAVPGAQPWPVIIQQPGQQQQPQDPFASFQPVMSMVKGVVSLAKDLIPPAAATPATASAEGTDKPFQQQLAEAVLIGALKSDKPPAVGELLGAINQNREPQWWESLADSTVLTEIVKPNGILSPLLTAYARKVEAGAQKDMAEARRAQAEADKLNGVAPGTGTAPVELSAGSPGAGAEGQPGYQPVEMREGAVSEQPPPMTPEQKSWYKTLGRMIDDCSDGANPEISARALYDVSKRYPEGEIKPTLMAMVTLPPEQVFDMLTAVAPNPQTAAYVQGLKQHQHFLLWMADLQKITQEVFAEEEEAENGQGENAKGA